jgi:hypothetical protein
LLTRTFLHVPGIGEHRERELWRHGYTDWEHFLEHHPRGPFRDRVARHLDRDLAARSLPRREAWRLAAEFPLRTAFVDIETEGLSPGRDAVTCVGLSDGRSVEGFVRGRNLDAFPNAITRFDLLVTYNGACFDLPMLQSAFPRTDFRRFHHLDLRYPLHRLGLRGGLKGIERQLGFARASEIEGADGYTAVLLWQAHLRGHPRALETLVCYCLEDVVHLKPLMAYAYNRLTASLPIAVPMIEDHITPEIPFRADGSLVRSLMKRHGYTGAGPAPSGTREP